MKKLLFLLLTAVLCIAAAPVFAGETPVEIASRQALEAIADNPYGQYVLTADIDMAGSDWTPIEFYGSLDGNGHTICNLHITQVGEKKARTRDGNLNKYDTYFASLFSVVKDAEIKNLHLLGVQIYAETKSINCFAAGLAELAENTIISAAAFRGVFIFHKTAICAVWRALPVPAAEQFQTAVLM